MNQVRESENIQKLKEIQLPLESFAAEELLCGERLLVSGSLLVGRDQAHKRMYEAHISGAGFPVSLLNEVIYYMGPAPAPEGHIIGSCGPTTSARMDAYTPLLLDNGLKGMIGKGPRSKAVVDAIIRNRAVYLYAFGGCGALYAQAVKNVSLLAYEDLGPEALYRLEIKHFPVIVAIDAKGNSLYPVQQ